MKTRPCYSESIAAIFDSLSNKDRTLLQSVLEKGFDDQAARELFDEGADEQQRLGACIAGANHPDLRFVPSSLLDLDRFKGGKHEEEVNRTLSALPDKLGTMACVRVPQRNGWILREGPYRIVFRVDDASRSIVVLGITVWACNPMLKIWRYLDQAKAEDLVRTSELYFRRADLLEDEYEATPTLGSYLDEQAAVRRALPGVSQSHPMLCEAIRHCTYVCCWRMSTHESWLAWKQYCPRGGGFAVQTTCRKLAHMHVRLKQSDDVHCREVTYINHQRDDLAGEGLGEQAFCKAIWFSDEHETRLVRFRDEYIGVNPEDLQANPELLPDGQRVRCDLSSFVESIVINPFATEAEHNHLTKLIKEQQPALSPKVHQSEMLQRPVGVR
jgi:mRNA-degrading endonuclease RelE of RelBE toxin-antitoxin system